MSSLTGPPVWRLEPRLRQRAGSHPSELFEPIRASSGISSAVNGRSVAEQSLWPQFDERSRPSRRVGVSAKPLGLEQTPIADLVERGWPLGGQSDMRLADLADIGVSFHHDQSCPRMGCEISEPETGHGAEPERTVVDHIRDRCGVRATVWA